MAGAEPANRSTMLKTARILTLLGLACLTGGMVFFGAVMAPLVFTRLPPATAGAFIRATFPFYYAYLIATAALAAAGTLLRAQRLPTITLAAIILVTLGLWFVLIPHLDALRAAHDTAAFNRGHTLSVYLNFAQLLAALWLLLRAAV